nr:unnamed protein product [Callosobruchus chinensis]
MENDLQHNYGVAMTEGQIMKKVNNMKTRLKKKIDLKQTGNVPIILSEWQKLLNEILEGDSNPSIKRSDEAVSLGVASSIQIAESQQSELELVLDKPSTSSIQNPPPKRPKFLVKSASSTNSLGELETAETRKLTTPQLQRLVLLEQLQVLRLKKEKLLKNQGEVEKKNNTHVDDDGTVFRVL